MTRGYFYVDLFLLLLRPTRILSTRVDQSAISLTCDARASLTPITVIRTSNFRCLVCRLPNSSRERGTEKVFLLLPALYVCITVSLSLLVTLLSSCRYTGSGEESFAWVYFNLLSSIYTRFYSTSFVNVQMTLQGATYLKNILRIH